ncbi:MAG: isopentenyl-diphosphate Delta-isomerase [Flavobacteriaceae bacterium]|nr:MAG: isopentenyl-diphosphate Delta-isomerase [Flavobacteriaceae bacterium]
MKEEQVILVDEHDNPLGLMPKMEAHQKAILHRAFSVFIFNDKKELMLQQRAANKYHSPLLWTNTCCSHQRYGETSTEAGKRRLEEEMGFSTDLKEVFRFIYKASFDNGLTEHELDHVMIGTYNGEPKINREEAASYKWMSLASVKKDIEVNPELYTVWFRIIFRESYDKL